MVHKHMNENVNIRRKQKSQRKNEKSEVMTILIRGNFKKHS